MKMKRSYIIRIFCSILLLGFVYSRTSGMFILKVFIGIIAVLLALAIIIGIIKVLFLLTLVGIGVSMNKSYKFPFSMEEQEEFSEAQKQLLYDLYRNTADKIAKGLNNIIDKDDLIYVVGFEHRYDYGSVILSFNTIKYFEKTLVYYQGRYPEIYAKEEEINQLKYNPGDFEYQGSCDRMRGLGYTFSYSVNGMNKEQFEKILQKVLEKFETQGLFNKLHKTDDFIYSLWEYD